MRGVNFMKKFSRRAVRIIGTVFAVIAFLPTWVGAWSEHDFSQNTIIIARSFVLPTESGNADAKTVIGSPREYIIQKKDTLLDIARYFDLGYNDIENAYPGIQWTVMHGIALGRVGTGKGRGQQGP